MSKFGSIVRVHPHTLEALARGYKAPIGMGVDDEPVAPVWEMLSPEMREAVEAACAERGMSVATARLVTLRLVIIP